MDKPVIAAAAAATAAAAAYFLWCKTKDPRNLHALRAKLANAFAASDGDGRAWLDVLASAAELPLDSDAFAAGVDASEPLRAFRSQFHIPPDGSGQQAYMAGNSLGLMPKDTQTVVQGELDKWARHGVGGHFLGELPWASCEDALPPLLAELVGAKDASLEIGAMNSLTVNLHLLMAAFYRPSAGRGAILIEADAFPSDRYAVGSQIRHHGGDPATDLIEVQPRKADCLLHALCRLAAATREPATAADARVQQLCAPLAHALRLAAAAAVAAAPVGGGGGGAAAV